MYFANEHAQRPLGKFDNNHSLLLEEENVDTDDNYFKNNFYGQIEEKSLFNLGTFQDYLITFQEVEATAARPETLAYQPEFHQTRLPQIELPIFSGEIQDWVRFRDVFEEMIIKRVHLAAVYKMHYLRSALKGEAAKLLQEMPAAGDNFEGAWKLVKSHYNNNRLLITKLLSRLMSINPMTLLENTKKGYNTKKGN